jgi:hypothetical protein
MQTAASEGVTPGCFMKAQRTLVAGSPPHTTPKRVALEPRRNCRAVRQCSLRGREGFRLLGQLPQLNQDRLVVIVVLAFDQWLVVGVIVVRQVEQKLQVHPYGMGGGERTVRVLQLCSIISK